MLSAARASGIQVRDPRPLLGAMAREGQPLYGCQTPDGYPDAADKWLSPDATMARVNFATVLGAGNLPVAETPPAAETMAQPVAALAADNPKRGEPVDGDGLQKLLAPVLSAKAREIISAAPPAQRAALTLGSPDFMRR